MDGKKAALFLGGAVLLTLGVIMLYNQGVAGTDKKPIGHGLADFFSRLKKSAPTSATGK